MLHQGLPTWMNLDRRMMRKVWAKAEMTEMMHWNLKRDLQLPLWNVKVKWMAQILLVRSQGGYHHALPLIGYRRLLKHSSVNQSLTLSTTLVSVVNSPFDQYLQKEEAFTKYMLFPQESYQSNKTVVEQYESMGGSLLQLLGWWIWWTQKSYGRWRKISSWVKRMSWKISADEVGCERFSLLLTDFISDIWC